MIMQSLGEDIDGHCDDVTLLDSLTQQLALLCTSGDKSFLTEVTNQVLLITMFCNSVFYSFCVLIMPRWVEP